MSAALNADFRSPQYRNNPNIGVFAGVQTTPPHALLVGAMNEQELKNRTKAFALDVLELVDRIPDTRSSRILANQLGRSGTSVGANYRSACRARSTADMISKISVVEEESDESGFWLELIAARRVLPADAVVRLQVEASELTAIMVASRRTLQRQQSQSKIQNRKSKIH